MADLPPQMITMKVPACRRNILDLMPPGPVVGVEIGTDTGINARELLSHRPDLFLWTVDPYGYSLGYEEHKDPGRSIAIRERAERIGEFERAGRTKHVRLTSVEAAKHFSGNLDYNGERRCMSFDFIYIDGDHSAKAVKEDLEAWWPLLHEGGLMAEDDFESPEVHTPVIEFAKRHRVDLFIINEHGGPDKGAGPGSGYDRHGGWAHPTFCFWKLPVPVPTFDGEGVHPEGGR